MVKPHLFIVFSLLCLFALSSQAKVTHTTVPPARIVWMSDNTGKFVSNPNHLLGTFSGQLSVSDTSYATLMSSDTHQASILLDFGKEMYGRIKIFSAIRECKVPVRLRIRLGESVTEAMSDMNMPDNPQNPTNEHSLRDFTVSAPWLGSFQCGNSGFRFARIDLLDKDIKYNLRHVSAVSLIRDIEDKGSFCSDNERINQIWQTGAYTVKLNMQEYLWDGIKRDRLGGDDDKQCIRGTRGGVQESRLCPRRYAFSGLDERDVLLFVVVDNHTEGLVYVPGQPRLLKKPARLFAPSRQADRRED